LGSAVATSMNLTNSSEPMGDSGPNGAYKMEGPHDMMYPYQVRPFTDASYVFIEVALLQCHFQESAPAAEVACIRNFSGSILCSAFS